MWTPSAPEITPTHTKADSLRKSGKPPVSIPSTVSDVSVEFLTSVLKVREACRGGQFYAFLPPCLTVGPLSFAGK